MNSTVKTIIFWVFILACLVLLWQIVQKSTGMSHDREISFSQFMQDAQQAKISDVTVINIDTRRVLALGIEAAQNAPVPPAGFSMFRM